MLEYVVQTVSDVENDPEVRSRSAALVRLRRLGLDDFGEVLLTMPNPSFPKLSSLLPAMAAGSVQRNWTGDEGLPLLKLTAVFVRTMSYAYSRITGKQLQGAKVLDFGCGYNVRLQVDARLPGDLD